MRRGFAAAALIATAVGLGCAADANPRSAVPVPQRSADPIADPPPASAPAPEDTREPVLLVTDPAALAVVAQQGADFGRLLFDAAQAGANNAELARSDAYRSVIDVLERDVQAIARTDPSAGVSVAGHPHRLFDLRWLRAASARFALIAVSNRIDRRALDAGGCGEARFIYRLTYDQMDGDTHLASRLPMTFAAELRMPRPAPDANCQRTAQRWLAPHAVHGAELGRWLVSEDGPLAPAQISRAGLIQLGVNLQSVRWPSGARADLGGHAEYVLRAFAWDDAARRYRPRKLENTPDVARLSRDHASRAALRAWIAAPANLHQIDEATAIVPDEFLAESIVSVTPRGFARRQNRAYRKLFDAADFGDLPLSTTRFTRSPEALLRRLDDLTCNGCHQSRSIAGFHVVGQDDAAALGNALASAVSPHVDGDLARRRAYLLGLSRAEPVDGGRPFAERASDDRGGYGAHCGLGDPGFAEWRCAEGLHCDAYEAAVGERTVGVCLPDSLRVGDPCQPARVRANDDPHRDRTQKTETLACDYVCEVTRVGFPGGMCASSCDALPSDAACGGIAILSDFNNCLARREPFSRCVEKHVRPAGLRACSTAAPCRDDYICARTADGGGACLPPYFVFQLRIDGHPAPG